MGTEVKVAGTMGPLTHCNQLILQAHALARLIEKRQAEEHLLLKNAELEEKVRERTAELQRHIQFLKEYQSQLIQSERMAALGGMVAGIAHEINTPIGIGFTSATYLKNRTQKFAERVHGGDLTHEHLRDYLEIALESSTQKFQDGRRGPNQPGIASHQPWNLPQ